MNEQEQRQHRRGRSFGAKVKADSMEQLEIGALEQAAAFFGPGVPLEVDTDYQATERGGFAIDGNGRYYALIRVWPVQEMT